MKPNPFIGLCVVMAAVFAPIAGAQEVLPIPTHAVRLDCGVDDAGFHLQETERAETSGRWCAEHPHHPHG